MTLIDHFILHKQLPQWVGARTDIIHVTHLMVGGDFSNCSIISPELLIINPMHQRLQEHEGGTAQIAQSCDNSYNTEPSTTNWALISKSLSSIHNSSSFLQASLFWTRQNSNLCTGAALCNSMFQTPAVGLILIPVGQLRSEPLTSSSSRGMAIPR